jgi:hypothetical protein
VPRFGLIVRHTDAEREWAYDRASSIGKLDKALDAAPAAGWTVVAKLLRCPPARSGTTASFKFDVIRSSRL